MSPVSLQRGPPRGCPRFAAPLFAALFIAGVAGGGGGSGGAGLGGAPAPSANCSGHGEWRGGCECYTDWFGAACDLPPDRSTRLTLWLVLGGGTLVASLGLLVYVRRRWRRRVDRSETRSTLVEPFDAVRASLGC